VQDCKLSVTLSVTRLSSTLFLSFIVYRVILSRSFTPDKDFSLWYLIALTVKSDRWDSPDGGKKRN
jgi:hypothetical protein